MIDVFFGLLKGLPLIAIVLFVAKRLKPQLISQVRMHLRSRLTDLVDERKETDVEIFVRKV